MIRRSRDAGLPISPSLATYIAAELCRGLAYAHERTEDGEPLGIVHRDVCPTCAAVTCGTAWWRWPAAAARCRGWWRCRGRGWCPSCTTRRAVETGLQLEEELPRVAHRQWTLSLPMAVRFQVVKQPALLKRLEVRLVQAVWRHQRATAKRLGARGPLGGGGVCFWQYFGSSLQLTPHLHLLVPEALWTEEGEVVTLPPPDAAQVTVLEGFSLHADTAVQGHDRQGLGRLCRYGARGPVSERRLEKLEDGRYRYTPKKGAAFTLTATALVKRLVALLPPPNRHLTSFHGVYGPNARLRPIVMTRPPPTAPTPAPPPATSAPKQPRRRIDWATLHRRTFVHPTNCTPPQRGDRSRQNHSPVPSTVRGRTRRRQRAKDVAEWRKTHAKEYARCVARLEKDARDDAEEVSCDVVLVNACRKEAYVKCKARNLGTRRAPPSEQVQRVEL